MCINSSVFDSYCFVNVEVWQAKLCSEFSTGWVQTLTYVLDRLGLVRNETFTSLLSATDLLRPGISGPVARWPLWAECMECQGKISESQSAAESSWRFRGLGSHSELSRVSLSLPSLFVSDNEFTPMSQVDVGRKSMQELSLFVFFSPERI